MSDIEVFLFLWLSAVIIISYFMGYNQGKIAGLTYCQEVLKKLEEEETKNKNTRTREVRSW